jgi:hypothetical protein
MTAMALHLLKMCVGVESVAQLRALQARRLERLRAAGEAAELRHWTRNVPRRGAEIEGQGSLYWIIKGFVRVRQGIVALERVDDEAALKRCAIVLDPALVETVPRRCRPMQGWRYLEAADAPADGPGGRAADELAGMPPEMVAELRALGLL